jgi:hypothetical protein
MRDLNRRRVYLLLLVTCVVAVGAQSPRKNGRDVYAGWQKVEFSPFSFYVPKELKRSKLMAYDLGYYRYESDNLVLDIATGKNAFPPSRERGFANYSHRSEVVNGAAAWIWHYDLEDGRFTHGAGARFVAGGPEKDALTITLLSKVGDLKEVAEKVFMSVRFEPEAKGSRGVGRKPNRQ